LVDLSLQTALRISPNYRGVDNRFDGLYVEVLVIEPGADTHGLTSDAYAARSTICASQVGRWRADCSTNAATGAWGNRLSS
jgi:hypothetical protein